MIYLHFSRVVEMRKIGNLSIMFVSKFLIKIMFKNNYYNQGNMDIILTI